VTLWDVDLGGVVKGCKLTRWYSVVALVSDVPLTMSPSRWTTLFGIVFSPKTNEVLRRIFISMILLSYLLYIVSYTLVWTGQCHHCRPYFIPGLFCYLWAHSKKGAIIGLAGSAPYIFQTLSFVESGIFQLYRKARVVFVRMPRRGDIELPKCQFSDTHDCETYFHHRPLNSSEKEIRLLQLVPGAEGEPVRVKIVYASLKDRPTYLCLSYVWGPINAHHAISIDSRDFEVRENLFQALEQLRNLKGANADIPFWIDAICIDQTNDLEKNEQVRFMKDIYSNALRVVVWMGLPTEDSELALATIRALEARMFVGLHAELSKSPCDENLSENAPSKKSHSRDGEKLSEANGNLMPSHLDRNEQSDWHYEAWEAIIEFLDNPWWTRAW
jgi:hypothetical protein